MFKKYIFALLFIIMFYCIQGYAEPWFTGPIVTKAGEVVPLGQGSFSLFNYYAASNAIYNRQWQKNTVAPFTTITTNPELIYGLTKTIDIEYDLFLLKNINHGYSKQNIGDSSIMVGFQVFKQDEKTAFPSLRFTINQTFPTGRYDRLNPLLFGTEATGSGSYQTAFGLNFQHRLHVNESQNLNTYLNIIYNYAASTQLNGLSVYGGFPSTHGYISPGDAFSLSLAFEYNLTQHWVSVLEGFFLYQQASLFTGTLGGTQIITAIEKHHYKRIIPSKRNIGKTFIGNGNVAEFTLFPEVEYNFTQHFGLIGGVWFTTTGKNIPEFISSSLSLVLNW